MDVDEEEAISTSASAWESIHMGKDDHEYRSAIIQMRNDIWEIQAVARKHVHSPKEWSTAWQDILEHRLEKPERALAAKVLIWLQTQSVLLGSLFHHDGIRLQTCQEVAVHYFRETFFDISDSRERKIRVVRVDCLEAAQDLQVVGFTRVAVLSMANSNKPGGLVKRGRDSQEEDLFCRTDISRHTERYLRGENYPCSDVEPVVMVQPGVTIMRGPKKDGYPFLNDIPEAITLISVAVKKKIVKYNDPATGKSLYVDIKEKEEMRRHIRLVLHAILKTDCTAVVLSALGCGLGGHPPEEVALMFKREIYRVGDKMPYIYFAVFDEDQLPAPTGNFEIFNRILVKPDVVDPSWKSAKDVYFHAVMASVEADFPEEETLGDAGGSGAKLPPKPTGEDKTKLQTQSGDVPMGMASSDPASGARKDDEGGLRLYTSDAADDPLAVRCGCIHTSNK